MTNNGQINKEQLLRDDDIDNNILKMISIGINLLHRFNANRFSDLHLVQYN
jgi:hypothetical protein